MDAQAVVGEASETDVGQAGKKGAVEKIFCEKAMFGNIGFNNILVLLYVPLSKEP